MTPEELDELYGVAVDPKDCSEHERLVGPVSAHILDETAGQLLQRFMSVADDGFEISSFIFTNLPILWVMSESGEFIFSCEEIMRDGTMQRLRPRFAKEVLRDGEQRLGHPSLVKGGAARIGGELSFDPGWGRARKGWKLSNSSRRYGTIVGRTSAHLENVRGLLETFHIKVDTEFLPPRSK